MAGSPHPVVARVTERIAERSATRRAAYLRRTADAASAAPARTGLGCANLAHGFAACGPDDKLRLKGDAAKNIAIVSSYNDMLSAHQPLKDHPDILKATIRDAGGTAQFAGGVPAMCDGITQGRAGMELSLFSRDVVAMSAAIALSHEMFDGALMLGVCDKIVPGLVIGALSFGHLPVLLVPAGPMPSGLPNADKAAVRKRFAAGEIGREELLEAESASHHAPGTCTFYGTANSNQLLMEAMGLHLPGASFVPPGTELREALTREAARKVLELDTPVGEMLDERAFVNGVVALLVTGGSTNHTLHLVAMAAAAGIELTWDDFDELSSVTPLLTRLYPNGAADVNHFHAAGGTAFLIGELLDAGLLHEDARTVGGQTLAAYRRFPILSGEGLVRRPSWGTSGDLGVLRPVDDPFDGQGGLRTLHGNLGRAVVKVSAVREEHRMIEAPPGSSTRSRTCRTPSPPGTSTATWSRSCVSRGRGPTACPSCTSSPAAVGPAGPWPPGRAGHRRPDVGCLRQRARRHPRLARGGRRWPAGPPAGRRHDPPRQRQGAAGGPGPRRGVRRPDPRRTRR